MKKFTSIFLAFIFIISSFCFADFEAYAKTVKNGKLSVSVSNTIYAKSKAQISAKYNKKNVTKRATYKSSNKKIASVNKKGVIKAVKKGTATITVKYNKKAVKIKIKVKKATPKLTAKVGNKTVKFVANSGIVAGKLKTKNGYITELPVAYKKGYETVGWYSGKTEYYYGSKISKNVTLTPKYKKLSENDYLDLVDLDYIKIYNNAYYDEYQVVMVDSGKGWKNNKEVKKYFLKNSIPKGYCPNSYFNPKAYMQIVKSKYGIELSSYSEALDFYLSCGKNNNDSTTLKCIHEGGAYDDTFSEVEYEYYQDKYEVYEPGGENYSMLCGECGKYFYGPTKHDDWAFHMFYICNVLGLPGSGWAPCYDQYRIFYKKEDHEHTDTLRRTYCQNEGKKKKEELLKQEYTPYRTDVAMSYPPTGPVLWYVDKF